MLEPNEVYIVYACLKCGAEGVCSDVPAAVDVPVKCQCGEVLVRAVVVG